MHCEHDCVVHGGAWTGGFTLFPLTSPPVWISLYYVAFYVVMTGLFALCIYTLMCTIDPYTPDYQDHLKSPGKGGSCLHPRTRCVGAVCSPGTLGSEHEPSGTKSREAVWRGHSRWGPGL